MKRLVPLLAIVLGWAATAWAAPPATLTTLRAIHAVTNAEASQKISLDVADSEFAKQLPRLLVMR